MKLAYCWIEIQPSLSGSILYLRVIDVKKDYSDVTMSIHNNILTCLAGDYDKQIKKIAIKKEKYKK